jgi:dTDP-4-amino-4,6-dideoxygalactose transaminase
MNSGTGALTLALRAISGNTTRKKVILPAYTCPSLLASIIKSGLEPVLCDLEAHSFQMDRDLLEGQMGPDVLAVIAVHLFGVPENILGIMEIAGEKGVAVIEDAAQAFGNRLPGADPATSNSRALLGSFGDIGILSFGRGKPLSFLAGGTVLVNNADYRGMVQAHYSSLPTFEYFPSKASYLLNLLLYAIVYHPNLYWIPQGIPWLKLGETVFSLDFEIGRLNPQALRIGRILMKNFERYRKGRERIARTYTEKLKELSDEFFYIPERGGDDICLLRFPVILKNKERRDRILVELKKRGLGATGMYPVPLNEQEGIPRALFSDKLYPNAKHLSERIMTLPLHEYVSEKEISFIGEVFRRYLQ